MTFAGDRLRAISSLLPGQEAESEAAYYTLKTVHVVLNCVCHPHLLTRAGHIAPSRNLCVAVVTWTFCIQVSLNPGSPRKVWVSSPWDSLLKPKAFEGKYLLGFSVWNRFSDVWAMAGETFGTCRIPSHVTPSALELRRHVKHTVTCLVILNRGCPLQRNPSGQRCVSLLMGSDQNPVVLCLVYAKAYSSFPF